MGEIIKGTFGVQISATQIAVCLLNRVKEEEGKKKKKRNRRSSPRMSRNAVSLTILPLMQFYRKRLRATLLFQKISSENVDLKGEFNEPQTILCLFNCCISASLGFFFFIIYTDCIINYRFKLEDWYCLRPFIYRGDCFDSHFFLHHRMYISLYSWAFDNTRCFQRHCSCK